MSELIIYSFIGLLIAFNSFYFSYFLLFRWFKKNNTKLIKRHIDDMSLVVNLNNRSKILENRLQKIIAALRAEKLSKQEILNCLREDTNAFQKLG